MNTLILLAGDAGVTNVERQHGLARFAGQQLVFWHITHFPHLFQNSLSLRFDPSLDVRVPLIRLFLSVSPEPFRTVSLIFGLPICLNERSKSLQSPSPTRLQKSRCLRFRCLHDTPGDRGHRRRHRYIDKHRLRTIFGSGEQLRAFSYIDDVAPILARGPLQHRARNEIFNVGADVAYSVARLGV